MVAENNISRTDIEAKLQELKGEVQTQSGAAKSAGAAVAVVAVLGVVTLAFLYGRRKGKRKSTVVEIRRV